MRIAANDLLSRRPPRGTPEEHLRAAEAWLVRAHDAGAGGVSYGYSVKGGWRPPYRETSGYIACTFLRLAHDRADASFRERGLTVARWLLGVQNADGSFSNPRYGADGIVFDTGQVLFGLIAAYRESGDRAFLEGARRAAAWLVAIADSERRWTKNEHLGRAHVYNTRTAWALLLFDRLEPAAAHIDTARRNLDWALEAQQQSGIFDHCTFDGVGAPYTHTLAYAARGLLESGTLLSDSRYVDAAVKCAEATLARVGRNGFLPGRIALDGSAAAHFACLTGQCQFAICWLRLDRLRDRPDFRSAAARVLDYVMDNQDIRADHPPIQGAVKGSQPVWGAYAPFCFPNWATKFFIDASWLLKKAS